MARTLVAVRDMVWLRGRLGDEIERLVAREVRGLPRLVVRRQLRSVLIESNEELARHLDEVRAACKRVEDHLAKNYPLLWEGFGPLWSGEPRVVYQEAA